MKSRLLYIIPAAAMVAAAAEAQRNPRTQPRASARRSAGIAAGGSNKNTAPAAAQAVQAADVQAYDIQAVQADTGAALAVGDAITQALDDQIAAAKEACRKVDMRSIKGLLIGSTIGGGASAIAGTLNFAGQIKNNSDLKAAKSALAAGNEKSLTDAAVADLVKQGYTEDEARTAKERIDAAVAQAVAEYRKNAAELSKSIKSAIRNVEGYAQYEKMTIDEAYNPRPDIGPSPNLKIEKTFNQTIEEARAAVDADSNEIMRGFSDETEATRGAIEACLSSANISFYTTFNAVKNDPQKSKSTTVSALIDESVGNTLDNCVSQYAADVEREPSRYIAGLNEATSRDRQIMQAMMDAKGANAQDLNINRTLAHQEAKGIGKLASGTGGMITSGISALGGAASAITSGIGIAQFSELEKEIEACKRAVEAIRH